MPFGRRAADPAQRDRFAVLPQVERATAADDPALGHRVDLGRVSPPNASSMKPSSQVWTSSRSPWTATRRVPRTGRGGRTAVRRKVRSDSVWRPIGPPAAALASTKASTVPTGPATPGRSRSTVSAGEGDDRGGVVDLGQDEPVRRRLDRRGDDVIADLSTVARYGGPVYISGVSRRLAAIAEDQVVLGLARGQEVAGRGEEGVDIWMVTDVHRRSIGSRERYSWGVGVEIERKFLVRDADSPRRGRGRSLSPGLPVDRCGPDGAHPSGRGARVRDDQGTVAWRDAGGVRIRDPARRRRRAARAVPRADHREGPPPRAARRAGLGGRCLRRGERGPGRGRGRAAGARTPSWTCPRGSATR